MIDSPLFDVQLHLDRTEGRNGNGQGGICVVTVSGEVDLASAPELDRVLSTAINSDCPEVVVDMAGVDFIDAAGVGVLVTGVKSAAAAGAHLQLRAPSRAVARILGLVGLEGALEAAREAVAPPVAERLSHS